jgi:hypothetical protein
VLRELKSSSFGAGLQQMDATTLDIVSMLFDQLFDDPEIPVGLKGLIGRLQIPMLKVAIADKSFFARKTHPARHLLDTLGDVAVRLSADFSADSTTALHLGDRPAPREYLPGRRWRLQARANSRWRSSPSTTNRSRRRTPGAE